MDARTETRDLFQAAKEVLASNDLGNHTTSRPGHRRLEYLEALGAQIGAHGRDARNELVSPGEVVADTEQDWVQRSQENKGNVACVTSATEPELDAPYAGRSRRGISPGDIRRRQCAN